MKNEGFILADALIVVVIVIMMTLILDATLRIERGYERAYDTYIKEPYLERIEVWRYSS